MDFLNGTNPKPPSFYDPTLPPTHPIPVSHLRSEPSEPDRKRMKLDPKS